MLKVTKRARKEKDPTENPSTKTNHFQNFH